MKPALPLNVEYQRYTKADGGFWKVVDSAGRTLCIVDPGCDFDEAKHLAAVIKTAILVDLSTGQTSAFKPIQPLPSQPPIPGLIENDADHEPTNSAVEAASERRVLQNGAAGA